MPHDQPIHLAAKRGDLAEVQRLLTEDPSLVERRGQERYTPLLTAARVGHVAIVEWLIDYGGANIEAKDENEWSVFFMSSQEGHLEVVSILLNGGADVNSESDFGRQPMSGAAWGGYVDIVELLLSQEGIELDMQDGWGTTALWTACYQGHDRVLSLLLAAGADPRIADEEEWTPVDIARNFGHNGCIRLLEADLSAPERARVLYRARAINDAHHAIDKAATETEGRTRGERKGKIIAAAPAYLKRRVGEGREPPQVEVMQPPRNADEEQEKLAAVVEHMVMDGQVPSEVFVELMEMMIPKWDDERRRV